MVELIDAILIRFNAAAILVVFSLLNSLRNDLYARLLLDDRWKEIMQQETRTVIQRNHNQASQVTLDELSAHLTQHGTAAVPAAICDQAKDQIRKVCFGSRGERKNQSLCELLG